jgi:hypothetical protein
MTSSPLEFLASPPLVLLVSSRISCLGFWLVGFFLSFLSSDGLFVLFGHGFLNEEA